MKNKKLTAVEYEIQILNETINKVNKVSNNKLKKIKSTLREKKEIKLSNKEIDKLFYELEKELWIN